MIGRFLIGKAIFKAWLELSTELDADPSKFWCPCFIKSEFYKHASKNIMALFAAENPESDEEIAEKLYTHMTQN